MAGYKSKRKHSMGFIYKLTCPKGKSYVGQVQGPSLWDVAKRLDCHCIPNAGCGVSAVMKQLGGWKAFKIEILMRCSEVDRLDDLEKQAILDHNTIAPNGYNSRLQGAAVVPKNRLEFAKQLALVEDRNAAYKQLRHDWHAAMWWARQAEQCDWGVGAVAEAELEWDRLWREANLWDQWKRRCEVNGKGFRHATDLVDHVRAMTDRKAAFVKMRKQWYHVINRAKKDGNEDAAKEEWTKHWVAAGLPLDRIPGQGYKKGWEQRRKNNAGQA